MDYSNLQKLKTFFSALKNNGFKSNLNQMPYSVRTEGLALLRELPQFQEDKFKNDNTLINAVNNTLKDPIKRRSFLNEAGFTTQQQQEFTQALEEKPVATEGEIQQTAGEPGSAAQEAVAPGSAPSPGGENPLSMLGGNGGGFASVSSAGRGPIHIVSHAPPAETPQTTIAVANKSGVVTEGAPSKILLANEKGEVTGELTKGRAGVQTPSTTSGLIITDRTGRVIERPPTIPQRLVLANKGGVEIGEHYVKPTSFRTRLGRGISDAVGRGGNFSLGAMNKGMDRWQAASKFRVNIKIPGARKNTGLLKFAMALLSAMVLLGALALAGAQRGTTPTGEAAPVPSSLASTVVASPLGCSTSMSAEDINNFFDQKSYDNFKGTGQVFLDAAQKYKINPALIIAIGIQESALGIVYRGQAAEGAKNAFGLMQSGSSLIRFSSWAEGIEVAFKTVGSFNCSTIECIGQKYAPIGADNDPKNLNQNWVPGVNDNLKSIPQSSCAPLLAEVKPDIPSGWPTTGKIIQEPYGGFSHKVLNAIDIANNEKTPIYSTLNGIVSNISYVDPAPGTGYGVMVTVTNNQTKAEVLFAHFIPNSNSHLTKGQQVNKGDLIGLMDTTGYSQGNHLHYELRGAIANESFGQFVPGGVVANEIVIKQVGNPGEWTTK